MDTTIELPSQHGNLKISHFAQDNQHGVLISSKEIQEECFIRIHSSCLFSEALHTTDCDCALQLDASIKYIAEHGGVVIYLYQEGRGVGLKAKIEAIALQQKHKIDTATAFQRLGHEIDPRDYGTAVKKLKELNIKRAIIATNNPQKISALEAGGIEITKRITLTIEKNQITQKYIDEKTKALGHYEETQ